MKKKELIDTFAARTQLSKKESKIYTELVFSLLEEELLKGGSFDIAGFGKFFIKEYKGKRFINPATGERSEVPSSKHVVFRENKKLKDKLNGKA